MKTIIGKLKENTLEITIFIIAIICFTNSLGILLNAISTRNLNNRLNVVTRFIEILHDVEQPGQYSCINVEEKGEDVVSRVMCENGTTTYETWTYEDGRVDVVVNGE